MFYLIGIGTNMGNRQENIENALSAINLVPKTKVFSTSAVYETEPVGYAEQNTFFNVVALVQSELNPNEMLGICLGIEAGFGRIREFKNGPRIIDIDVLMAQDMKINTANLVLPHPRMMERRFVLRPMLDIFTDGIAFGTDFKAALDKIDGQKIKKVN